MNLKTGKNSTFFWPLALYGTLLAAALTGVHAQDGSFDQGLGVEGGEVYNSEQFDVDGIFTRKERPVDKVRKQVNQLKRQIEEGVEQKIEEQRLKQEVKVANRLRRNLEKVLSGDLEKAETSASAAKVQAPAPTPVKTTPTSRVSLLLGSKYYDQGNNDGLLNLDGSASQFGVSVETLMSDNFSLGVEFGRSSMNLDYNPWGYDSYYYSNPLAGNANNARVDYASWDLAMKGKFYIGSSQMIRPFFGLLIGANRSSVEWVNNEAGMYALGYNYSVYPNRNSNKVSAVNLRGAALAGVEIEVADNVGLGVDFRYSKMLKSGFDRNNRSRVGDFRQEMLTIIGKEIEDLDVFGANFSVALKF